MANTPSALSQASLKTSPPTSPVAPGAPAQDGLGDSASPLPSPPSPALSSASTADGGEDELGSSPALPPIPAPRLPDRALELLRTPPSGTRDEFQFGTASWGSPYPRADHNLRRQSFSSEASDDSPIHHLAIDTPFLRPAPELSQADAEPQSAVSAAAAVLANRARRRTRGLTEDWIRTHTRADSNIEPRLWFSDGSGSEHSSLSGSESGWLEGSDLQTPKAPTVAGIATRRVSRHPRGRSSVETLRPEDSAVTEQNTIPSMATDWADMAIAEAADKSSQAAAAQDAAPATASPKKLPVTPTKLAQKPLPKEPAMTPRIKKRVPWRGKNIMVFLPRDDDRGLPSQAPMPLRQDEIERMYASWEELGYNVAGFDLLVEDWRPQGTDDSQSRDSWPNADDVVRERSERLYKVALPDKNTWDTYVRELQEAKLRALGVSSGDEEPDPNQSISPATTQPSRQASAQYPPLPFSPPLPTSSASSTHGIPGFPFPAQFVPGLGSAAHSPSIPSVASPGPFGGAPGKYNPRQSISFPATSSPFQSPGWPHSAMLPGSNRSDSPSLANLNGILSPQSPFGFDNIQPTGSPSFGLHQRTQSLQFPMLPHQSFQQARASPRLQEVREDDEEEASKSPSKTPEPPKQNPADLQAEIDDAEYHLEESFRNQLEHEDYNPQPEQPAAEVAPVPAHSREASGAFPVPEHFANEPTKPLVLHHPRPHSRGHSLSQNFFRDHNEIQGLSDSSNRNALGPLKDIVEAQKGDDSYEIETNPSNLGTPVQEFGFSSQFKHQKSMSTASNPWNDATSVHSNGSRRSSHGSKPSFSKLNVKAPEFKFNPTSSFTPGSFNFSGNTFQPSTFQASFASPAIIAPIQQPLPQPFGLSVNAASFAPGQSDFSFSTSGPKFRPDAPAFTPLGAPTAAPVVSDTSGAEDASENRGSIFGKIDITDSDVARSNKKSKAIPIIRPSSQSPARSIKAATDDELPDDIDGRLVDESRYKRARSSAPDGDDVPLFAARPEDLPEFVGQTQSGTVDEKPTDIENDEALPVDTSISSLPTSDQNDTKATTAVTSQNSPVEQAADNWVPFEFRNNNEVQAFNNSRPFGEGMFNKRPTHKKSLSATAQPFMPGAVKYGDEAESSADEELLTEEHALVSPVSPLPAHEEKPASPSPPPKQQSAKGLGTSRFASPPPKPKGLAASRFAAMSPPPEDTPQPTVEPVDSVVESVEHEPIVEPDYMRESEVVMPSVEVPGDGFQETEPTVDEIDAILLHMQNDPSMGVNKTAGVPHWQQPSTVADVAPFEQGQTMLEQTSRDSASPTPRAYDAPTEAAPQYTLSAELEDPFLDPPVSPPHGSGDEYGEPAPDTPLSDWEAAFSEDEHDKLESRAQFFDGRVNEVVGNLLASRLDPLEKTLFSIQQALATRLRRTPSSRRDMRSVSAELQESDADDEDEEPVLRRSMSPRRDRRLDQIRIAVTEALAAQQRSQSIPAIPEEPTLEQSSVLKALQEMKEHLGTNLKANIANDDLKTIVQEAVQSRMLAPQSESDSAASRMDELQAKIADLEQRLYFEQNKMEKEVSERRAAEDLAAELNRKLQAAETRVEVEIINRSVFDQRVTDLEEKLRHQEDKAEQEVQQRRNAEDRLSEVQRLLRISSEEETRLREVLEEREQRIKTLEQSSSKSSMRMTLLEASQKNATQTHTELTNKINALEVDLRNVRQDNHQWRAEAERAEEASHRSAGELAHIQQENKHLQKSLNTLTIQLEENERLRESWRAKFLSLQDDMSKAAREVAEENARRIKKEQTMLARQDVLDARLQAEAKTRERLEVEMERLQTNERDGMRAVNECKRLESLLGELRTENHKLEESALRYQREFQEARESGLSEVKRTRISLQMEIDAANNQVNIVREELEEQNAKLRAELDNVRLDADTAKAQNEMLLEEAQSSKVSELNELRQKHQNELEDLQTRYERQVNNAVEDGQKSEQHLLERLSLSSSKIEHLQDRIVHLEDKLEIAKQAAAAAAQAAKSAGAEASSSAGASHAKSAGKLDVPERISPQALRESIMVLQEQLQAREQRIEELEQIVAKADPDAATKISKRDDEISWLRELLAVRHGDLQDIITALSSDAFDREALKDATIRLKANLQMEEQERERAVNGGSAINLPNIAQTIQAATPRIAQTVGPIAAAWGNWRKGNQSSFRSISGVLSSPAQSHNSTPSRSSSNPQSNLLGGLLTPPASGLRQTPPVDTKPQPTAFGSTGRRYTSQGNVPARVRGGSTASRRSENLPAQETPPRRHERPEPMTPPMMVSNAYDSDAQPGDFDDHDFFDEED